MPEIEEKARYSIAESIQILGISRTHFYRQVKKGKYQVIHDGGRTFMTAEQLEDAVKGDGHAETTNG